MNYNNTQAIFIQIVDLICERVLNEYYKPEERSPSVRELAAEMQVNPNTVMRSYERLQNNGIIYNRRGIGYFFTHNAKDKIINMRHNQFIEETLPAVFKEMILLNVKLEDLIKAFNTFTNKTEQTM